MIKDLPTSLTAPDFILDCIKQNFLKCAPAETIHPLNHPYSKIKIQLSGRRNLI
jgi:hypothetical protein